MNRTFFRAELKHNLPGFEWTVRKHTTGDTFFEAAGCVLGDVDKSRRGTFRGRKILATAYVYYSTTENNWCIQLEISEIVYDHTVLDKSGNPIIPPPGLRRDYISLPPKDLK